MRKWMLLFAVSIYSPMVSGQIASISTDEAWDMKLSTQVHCDCRDFHSSIFPYHFDELFSGERVLENEAPSCKTKSFLCKISHFRLDSSNEVMVSPLFEYSPGRSVYSVTNATNSGLGALYQHKYRNSLALKLQLYSGYNILPWFTRETHDSLGIVPGYGFGSGAGGGYSFHDNQIYFDYKLNTYFRFSTGYGKHFVGDGFRSIFLSDQGASYPFFRIETKFWKIKYMVLYSWLKTYTPENKLIADPDVRKYSVTHYLSFNASKRWNINLFEAVVGSGLRNQERSNIDMNFYNPVIFFRPVDFGIGSPSNILLGAGFKYKLEKSSVIYGQLLLDDFYLSDLKEDMKHVLHPNDSTILWGHWFNKQAAQIGVLVSNPGGLEGFRIRAEANFARPYTWSHKTTDRNYSHQNQALAHPLGSNFAEYIVHLSFYHNQWKLDAMLISATTGLDLPGFHNGGNIFQPSFDDYMGNNIPVKWYGNYIGQGVRKKTCDIDIRLAYQIIKGRRFHLFAGLHTRTENYQSFSHNYLIIRAG
ncbi:MAG: hypothetical protein KKA07_02660, partial [Bacteroidetes bacterium]|nr:hypothetical protein [Bacteroidota bacterium]